MLQTTKVCLLVIVVALVNRTAGQCGGIIVATDTVQTINVPAQPTTRVCQWYTTPGDNQRLSIAFTATLAAEVNLLVRSFGTTTHNILTHAAAAAVPTPPYVTDGPTLIVLHNGVTTGDSAAFSFTVQTVVSTTPLNPNNPMAACGSLVSASNNVTVPATSNAFCTYVLQPPEGQSAVVTFSGFTPPAGNGIVRLATLTEGAQNETDAATGLTTEFMGSPIVAATMFNPTSFVMQVEMRSGGKSPTYSFLGLLILPILFIGVSS